VGRKEAENTQSRYHSDLESTLGDVPGQLCQRSRQGRLTFSTCSGCAARCACRLRCRDVSHYNLHMGGNSMDQRGVFPPLAMFYAIIHPEKSPFSLRKTSAVGIRHKRENRRRNEPSRSRHQTQYLDVCVWGRESSCTVPSRGRRGHCRGAVFLVVFFTLK